MGKIDIRDLRVGDWVCFEYCSIPIQVKCVKDDIIYFKHSLNFNRSIGFTRIDRESQCSINADIHPIPLTGKILENNGFVKRQPNIVGNKNCLGTWFNSKTVTTIKEYFIDREHSVFVLFGCYSMIGNIKFVHQLQNALRDCGIDKEITL